MPTNYEHVKKMSENRKQILTESMDAHKRDTDEASLKIHIVGVKNFINNREEYNADKFKDYVDEYCSDDDNFQKVETVEKPQRTLSEEQKAKMKAGREAAKAARAAAAAEKAKGSEEDEAEEVEDTPLKKKETKPKAAKAAKA
jgi:type IV secretory pathway component VirB8